MPPPIVVTIYYDGDRRRTIILVASMARYRWLFGTSLYVYIPVLDFEDVVRVGSSVKA